MLRGCYVNKVLRVLYVFFYFIFIIGYEVGIVIFVVYCVDENNIKVNGIKLRYWEGMR